MILHPAPLESERFGLRVYRATVTQLDTTRLLEELVDECVDLAIIRTPARIPAELDALATRGLHIIHADTLVSYECRLTSYCPKELTNSHFQIDRARSTDHDGVLELVQTVFAEYPNHYRANPLLSPDAIVAGYGEWALSHIDDASKLNWVVRTDGRISAMACTSFDGSGMCQGMLHGVHPDFSGRGIYTDLIRYTQRHFRQHGCHTLKIQTQVGNLHVQRVWTREGFALTEVFNTFHVNALLDSGPAGCHHATISRAAEKDGMPWSRTEVAACLIKAANNFTSSCNVQASEATSETCEISVWSLPAASGQCKVCVRAYPTTREHDLVAATLHDAGGKNCAIARFDVPKCGNAGIKNGSRTSC